MSGRRAPRAGCVACSRFFSYAEQLAGTCAVCHPERFRSLNPKGADPSVDLFTLPPGRMDQEATESVQAMLEAEQIPE